MAVYVAGAPFYEVPGGGIAQAVNNGDGWEYPLALVDDDGRHVSLVPDGDVRIAQWFASELGFDPYNKRVAANGEDVEIYSPLSGRWVPAVATGSGMVMPIDMARAAGQQILHTLREPKEGSQLAEFGGTVASIAATFASAYAAGSFIDSSLGAVFGGSEAAVADAALPSVFEETDLGMLEALESGGQLPAGLGVPDVQWPDVFQETDAGMAEALADPVYRAPLPDVPSGVDVFQETDSGMAEALQSGGRIPAGLVPDVAPAGSGLLNAVKSAVESAGAAVVKALGVAAVNTALEPDRPRAGVAYEPGAKDGGWMTWLIVGGVGLFLIARR